MFDPIDGTLWEKTKVRLLEITTSKYGDVYGTFLHLEDYRIDMEFRHAEFKKGSIHVHQLTSEYKNSFIAESV